jgi:DNA-binding Xre family transcriptional regulator
MSNYLNGNSAEEITLEICRRMEQMRVDQNISQNDIAAEVGITDKTYRKLKAGDGKLINFVAVLNELGIAEDLLQVLKKPLPSPIHAMNNESSQRKRVSSKSSAKRLNVVSEDDLEW